jgi:glycosyltransferase involved in cell wall biosynthesis/SAM-dependent methyltransferase
MHACTIIAKNYLAQARVLARTFLEHNPSGEFSVLVIDDTEGYIDDTSEPFTLLSPRDIGCEPFTRMAARYDVLELSTAVKPWLLRSRLDAGADTITYLDPDIQVFGPLDHLDSHAREHGLVLTPHNTVPIPDDGERPTQIDIMIAGVYNLGYVSIASRDDTDALIEWWCGRLTRDCRVDPVYGYFVDQRWFDLAPGFVGDYSIIREPEYNVAYWNVHARTLTNVNGDYQVDGRPLAFFHFSGFDPADPAVLSRHQTRIELAEHPVLRELCDSYANATLGEGYEEARAWPYTYNRLADGTPMTRPLRALYGLGEDDGALTQSPFRADGCRALLDWAGDQEPDAPAGISRALALAYRTRQDLRIAFPDLDHRSREVFLALAADRGVEELGLPEAILPRRRRPLAPASAPGPAARPPATPPWGVNVVGYFRSELGVGEAGRQVISALDAADVPLLPLHGDTVPLNRQGHAFTHLAVGDARYPVNVICMNADALPELAAQAGPELFDGRYSIGLWFWEVTTAPAQGWRRSFELLDEVWVPTAHVAEAVAPISPIPVVHVTLPIEMTPTDPLPRDALDLSDAYMYLFSFDYLSVFKRKNPLAVVEAYCRAFPSGDEATLVIKSINDDRDPAAHARLRDIVAQRPDIRMIDDYLDPWMKDALTASCDCYVSLHRSEGFGLTMAEAMYLGKPVIATGYSGNLDFMTNENSYLVDYELVPIGDDAVPYPAEGEWAEPDVEHAARLMRRVFDDRDESQARGRHAAQTIRQTHSAAAAGAKMRERLHAVAPAGHGLGKVRTAVDPGLAEAVAQGPVAPPRSAAGPLGPALRRAALRLMKPLSAYQGTINAQLTGTVQGLDSEVSRIGVGQQRTEAADLAHARRSEGELGRLRRDVAALNALHDPIVKRLDGLSGRVQGMEGEARALPYMSSDAFTISDDPIAGRVQGYESLGDSSAAGYRSFEDLFRGSEEFIRSRQARFIPLLEGHEPVIDIGCGRCELLDLLRDRGIAYCGVDSDADMVARAHEKGHADVVQADGVEYLAGRGPGDVGAIFAAQVIEHMPYETLVRFLELARRVLRPGGVLIAETVNPHSAPALKAFWVDLTHQHPIFPEVALALCRSAGFERAYVFHPNGTGDVEADRYTTGEYAVVATAVAPQADNVAGED